MQILARDDVEISVTDNGQGISAALLPSIFDLFVQGKRSIDQVQGGLWVGLALVKKITQLHGGTVSADSPGAGLGARLTLCLPRLRQVADHPTEPVGPGQRPDVTRALQLLVVDDNEGAANSLALLLAAHGHTATVEYSAKAALERVHATEFDAIMLDVGLPGKDGCALCRQMRVLPHLSDTVFLAVSGYGQQADVEMSLEAGFIEHLTKPVSIEEVVGELARA